MTVFLQIASLGVILGLLVGWGAWIYETHRRIDAPQFLTNIHVHGVDESSTEALAQSIAVGVVGQIAEHKRVVEFVNAASAAQRDHTQIGSYLRVSQPAPSLIAAAKADTALDITVEVAGTTVETKGLQALFASGPKRGGLTLSMILEEDGQGKFKGLVSASFTENSAYGFSQEVEGTPREIAQQVAMRFVQAHYGANDEFFDALAPSDFRRMWAARRKAAEIALQWASGGDLMNNRLRDSAKAAYGTIADMASHYAGRADLQRLAAYLARASDEFQSARVHLEAVLRETTDTHDRDNLKALIAALQADEDTKKPITVAAAEAPTEAFSPPDNVDTRESLVLRQPHLEPFGLSALAERARTSESDHEIKVALVLGGVESFEPFGDRIAPAGSQDTPPSGRMRAHVEEVASLVTTFAPKAKLLAYRAIDDDDFGKNEQVATSILRAAASDADIILIPLGGPGGFNEELKKAIVSAAQTDKLVLLPAGNEHTRRDKKVVSDESGELDGKENVLLVGAWEETQPAPYSNYGPAVAMFAPGKSLVISRDQVTEMQGTSVAVAIAAAAAVNARVLAREALSGVDLAKQLKAMTREENGQSVLHYQAPN